MAQSAQEWRDRLAGRPVAVDRATAVASVRQSYRASGLPEPDHVLWVNGPREAAQALAFVENPPRKLKRRALAIQVMGAAGWVGLISAIDRADLAETNWAEIATWSIVLAAFGVGLGVLPRLPSWPGLPATRSVALLVVSSSIVFATLAGHFFASYAFGGLPAHPIGRGVALVVAALVGALPGSLVYLRLWCAFSHLPRFLRELGPSRSVAHRLERSQWEAWEPYRRLPGGASPNTMLQEAYRRAHGDAFARLELRLLEFDGPLHARSVGSGLGAMSITANGLTNPHWEAIWRIPPHLDGIDSVSRAAAVAGAVATAPATAFADLAYHVERLYPFAEIAVIVQPATTIVLDAEGRPHAQDGPALAWADGTVLYAWHGQPVPPDLIDLDWAITLRHIHREQDLWRRWFLIERYGLGRYLLEAGAREVQQDECGRLYRLDQGEDEPIVAVRVVNHTPEPDGTLREFWLRVPPTMTTARQAVAWTFDLRPYEYDPVMQS